MVLTETLSPVTRSYLFLANVITNANIIKVIVPEIVQNDSEVIMDCQYFAPDNNIQVLWFHNDIKTPIYKWSPHREPQAFGIFEGKLDLHYKISSIPKEEGRAVRIPRVETEMTGEYTCVLIHKGVSSRQTRAMLVYSPEREFNLIVKEDKIKKSVDIICDARGLYPQPDMIIEHNKSLQKELCLQEKADNSNGVMCQHSTRLRLIKVRLNKLRINTKLFHKQSSAELGAGK